MHLVATCLIHLFISINIRFRFKRQILPVLCRSLLKINKSKERGLLTKIIAKCTNIFGDLLIHRLTFIH